MVNSGHEVKFIVSDSGAHNPAINITGGPLAYKYQVTEISIHFGATDNRGSEHTIDGYSFPAEV